VDVFEGGWYVLPAVAAFAALRRRRAVGLPAELPPDRDEHEIGARSDTAAPAGPR
jgi:hypothetical protein